jgi:cytochrome c
MPSPLARLAAAGVALAGAALLSAGTLAASQPAQQPTDGPMGFGRPASPETIQAMDIDVRPDGMGLPAGSGTASAGAVVYDAKCAMCHGDAGEGTRAGPALVETTAFQPGVTPTVGNYWPYATTVWDYIYRAMPFNAPGSLTPDEVYALTAYVLFANGIIAEDAVMNAQTLPQVVMPNADGFTSPDPRPDTP